MEFDYTDEEIAKARREVVGSADRRYDALAESYIKLFLATLSANRAQDEYNAVFGKIAEGTDGTV